MKKAVAFLLALIALISAFAGCSPTEVTDETTLAPETAPATQSATMPATEPATEPDTTVSIGGIPLSEFTIVYSASFENAAAVLGEAIEKVCGEKPKTSPEEVTVNSITLSVSDELSYDDFKIIQNGSSLEITGGTLYAAETACARFIDVFTPDKYKYDFTDFCISYTLPDRNEYIEDISQLALHWDLYFDTPEWMLDFEEKHATAMIAGGRLMSSAHRGDLVYYPENSIEGIISAIMMGCDMVEVDPRLTKDGVFVLIHDATLTRTTNHRELAGRNGLPMSDKVADWTYDQLMQLNLKEGKGGSGTEITPYKIPTLDELFKVCAGRILVQLDVKGPGNGKPFWDFEKDVWPLLEKYDCYPQVIFTWHDWLKENNYSLIITHLKKTQAKCGKKNMVIFANQGSYSKNDVVARRNGFTPCVRLLNFSGADYQEYLTKNQDQLDSYKGKFRTYANVTCKFESQEFYAELYEAGITFQLVNKALDLCTYISATFEPTPYN